MSGSSKPKDDASTSTSLASVGGTIVGAGIAELQANVTAGLILVVVGVAVLLFRAYVRAYRFNIVPEILTKPSP
jgi:hypothetical protein